MGEVIQMIPLQDGRAFFLCSLTEQMGDWFLNYRVSTNPRNLISDIFKIKGEQVVTTDHHFSLFYLYKFMEANGMTPDVLPKYIYDGKE